MSYDFTARAMICSKSIVIVIRTKVWINGKFRFICICRTSEATAEQYRSTRRIKTSCKPRAQATFTRSVCTNRL